MTRRRYFLLIMALLLIVFSWWGVAAARTGLIMRSLNRDGIPLLYVAPQSTQKVPGVLVAHGFAGSKQLMLSYAHVLAHGGYAVVLWDFAGHAANAAPIGRLSLQQDLDKAYAAIIEQPEVDRNRLALLGHSMGSGAVMSAGIRNIDRFAATIAISPTGAQVTPSAPRNLQLQAGSWEGGFIKNAQQLLAKAGGENQNLAQGKGRSLLIIPNAEHITILFRNASHQAALKWLNTTFGMSRTNSYIDLRMLWYALHLLAWLILLGAVAPALAVPATESKVKIPLFRSWGGLLFAPFLAGGFLSLLSRVVDIQNLGGLQVGGAVGLWFLVAGITWLAFLFQVPPPTARAVGVGVALFLLFWIAFGAMAQVVWLQWWLIPLRLTLWLVFSVICFPWFLASGIAQQGVGVVRRVVWWFWQSLVLVGSFVAVIYLLPQLGFIFLLLPLFPFLTVIFSLAGSLLDEAWSYALGSTLFFGWMIAAAFPLSA
ncbi:MAG TPA: alpha/beta hydrolase [Cyanobacteria bacterium UBA8543]|nr:alpha/beta hydrolase [Cyanobacteria bacterium UBA8543]